MVHNEPIVADPQFPNFVIGLKIFECIFILFDLLFLRLYIKVITRKKFCHPNLLLMLLFQPVCQGLSLALRIVKHGMETVGMLNRQTLDVINYFIDIFLVTGAQAMIIMAVERAYAMWRVEDYEADSRAVLGYFLCAMMLTVIFIYITSWHVGILSDFYLYLNSFFLMCISTGTLRNELWHILGIKRGKVENMTQIRTVTGGKLVFSGSEQCNMHFDAIQKAWDSRTAIDKKNEKMNGPASEMWRNRAWEIHGSKELEGHHKTRNSARRYLSRQSSGQEMQTH